MKSNAKFVEGGGWVKRQTIGRPKTRFFGFLSIIWLGVSICGSFPFWNGWPQSFGYLEWLCVALFALLPVFAGFALVFWLTEPPRAITELHPNPDYDIRKLY
jgi:hypothetical protein